jgi:hypothetical protein
LLHILNARGESRRRRLVCRPETSESDQANRADGQTQREGAGQRDLLERR